jgi:hypothetical protein
LKRRHRCWLFRPFKIVGSCDQLTPLICLRCFVDPLNSIRRHGTGEVSASRRWRSVFYSEVKAPGRFLRGSSEAPFLNFSWGFYSVMSRPKSSQVHEKRQGLSGIEGGWQRNPWPLFYFFCLGFNPTFSNCLWHQEGYNRSPETLGFELVDDSGSNRAWKVLQRN